MALAGAALLAACGSDGDDRAPEFERAGNRDEYVLSPERRRQVEREQAAKTARIEPARDVADRRALLRSVQSSILRDARARVKAKKMRGPIRRVVCEPTTKSIVDGRAPERDLSRPRGVYSCTAVTNELELKHKRRGHPPATGYTGHPFRAVVNFDSGEYAWCKRNLAPGEGGIIDPRAIVGLPAECKG